MITRAQWVLWGSLSALLMGLLAGSYFPELIIPLEFISKVFINGLKLILVPLIISSIVLSVSALSKGIKSGGVLFRTFIYFISTTSIAVITGIFLTFILPSGADSDQDFSGTPVPQELQIATEQHAATFLDDLIPSSVPQAILNGNYAAIILVSIILAVALSLVGRSSKIIFDINQAVYDLVFKLADFMMVASPIAIFVLTAMAIGNESVDFSQSFSSMKSFMLIFISGLLIHALFTLPLLLKSMGKQNPVSFFKGMLPALVSGFGVSSATTNLPLTNESLINRCKSNKNSAGIVLPLGAVFNLNSTAMFAAIATIVTANIYGIELSFVQILLIGISAILGSFALAGLPFSALILTTAIFSIVDFPNFVMGIIGVLFLLEWLNDRLRTVVNIWSDAIGSAVMGEYIAPQVRLKTTSRSYQRRDSRTDRTSGDSRRDSRGRSPRGSSSSYERKPRGKQTKPYGSTDSERSDRVSKSFGDKRQSTSSSTKTESTLKKDSRLPRETRAERPKRVTSKPTTTSPFEIYSKENQPLDLDTPLTTPKPPRKVTPRATKPASERKTVERKTIVARKLPSTKKITAPDKPTAEKKPVTRRKTVTQSKATEEPKTKEVQTETKTTTKTEPKIEPRVEPKKEVVVEEKIPAVQETGKPEIQFGRGKKRSSTAPPSPPPSSDKPDSESNPESDKDSAIASKQSYGRGKKKKP